MTTPAVSGSTMELSFRIHRFEMMQFSPMLTQEPNTQTYHMM